MPTETPDLLERLQAVNPAAGDDPAPAWEDTRRRLAPAPRTTWRPRRVLVLGGAVAAMAVAATFIVDSGETPRRAPLGSSRRPPPRPRRTRASPGTRPRRASPSTLRAPAGPTRRAGRSCARSPTPSTRRARSPCGPCRRSRSSCRPGPPSSRARRRGAVRAARRRPDPRHHALAPAVRDDVPGHSGLLPPGQQGAARAGPDRPGRGRRHRRRRAAHRVPAGLHPEMASLIQEAGRSPIARTLIYAGNVLTAPRVSPDVRSAVYTALSRVAAVKVDPTAKDAFGRPGGADRRGHGRQVAHAAPSCSSTRRRRASSPSVTSSRPSRGSTRTAKRTSPRMARARRRRRTATRTDPRATLWTG